MKIENLATLIRTRRKSLRITQTQLGEICGLTLHTISNIESGKGNPTLKVLNKLFDALGLTMEVGAK